MSLCNRWQRKYSLYEPLDWLATLLPCVRWLRSYRWEASLPVRVVGSDAAMFASLQLPWRETFSVAKARRLTSDTGTG